MVHGAKKLLVVFYSTRAGGQPVRDWLNDDGEFNNADRKAIGTDVAKAEYGWPIGLPTCEPLGGGLFEIRTNLANNRITRIIFSIEGGKMVLLHGFVKKARDGIKTPQDEIGLADKRRRDLRGRERQAKKGQP